MDMFERRKNAPLWWYNKSADFHASAGALWLSMDDSKFTYYIEELNLGEGFRMSVAVFPVFMMLCGMSLELIYKAIRVAKEEKVGTHHRLIDLAQSAGVKIDKNAEAQLKDLTEYVIWEGKYPVPKDNQKKSFFRESSRIINWDSYNALWKDAVHIFFEYYS